MHYLRSAIARLLGVFTRDGAEADLREELEAHVEMETAEYIRRGMAPEAARRRARLAAGGLTQAAEAVRDQRGLPWLESGAADLRYAFRSLRHNPVFTTVVVLTLALGIGANTAIFSVVRAVLLKPLPHREGDRLLYLRQSTDGPGGADIQFSVPETNDLRARVKSIAAFAEYSPWGSTLQGVGEATRITTALVTGNYFDVMGLAPVLGRLTRPSDDGPGVEPVMVLTHEFWLNRFGGDSNVVNRVVRLDDTPVRIIGVLQPAPSFPDKVDAINNMVLSKHHLSAQMVQGRTHRMTELVARLAPDATLQQARNEVATAYAQMHAAYPEAYDAGSHFRVAVIPFRTAMGEKAELTVWLLMAAAAFVMIIAVANVVNLTLMRGVRREHELVARAALGAGVGRLRRLLLAENLLLSFAGAVLGVLIALGGVRLLISFAARYSVRAGEIGLDASVLGYTVGMAILVAALLSFVGTLPREGTIASVITAGGRRLSGGLRKHRLQRGLVIAQVAVSVVLLAGAGLLTRTLIRLSEVGTGLKTEQVLTMQVSMLSLSAAASGDPARFFAADAAAKSQYTRVQQELRAIPGVIEVGVGSPLPLRGSGVGFPIKAEDHALPSGAAVPRGEFRIANPEFFRASGIPLLSGREFTANDVRGSERVVIINKQLADLFFPGESPIGKRIAWTGEILKFTPISGDWRTVVGVVGNLQEGGPDGKPRNAIYTPLAQEFAAGAGLVIRTDGDAPSVAAAATRIITKLAPNTPIEDVMTIAQYKAKNVSTQRLNAMLLSSFGALALIIAAVGIAGVLAFSVSARVHEIGIRMSLGADRWRVERMILGEGGLLVIVGLLIGVAGAWFGTGLMRGLLFGVAPHDPPTFIVVGTVMGTIGILACWIPALRAARVDPAVTMRSA